MSRGRFCLYLFIALLFASGPALAAAGAKATLQRINSQVDKLLRRQVAAGSPEEAQIKGDVKKLAAELLDYGELARRALGEHWDKLKPAQRTDFVSTFKELIERNYVRQIRTNLDYEVSYGSETLEDQEARVQSRVKVRTKGKATDVQIEYRMIKNGDRWMVYDIVTDELSLVRNYRSQFQRIIAGQGYDGLVQRMKSKLKEEQG
jgi:phospholipid transport system substrate-binding protein